MDRERRKPMADDTIFRLYSMTKPITSVALMSLYEQGHFQLNDPVSRFIPAWREHKVWVSGEGAEMQTVAPEKPMTMRHVLSHTGGLTYGATNHPVDRVYREAGVNRGAGETLATFAEKLAKVPLRYRARRALDVLVLDRRVRLPRRGDFRKALRPILAGEHFRSARHEGHFVLRSPSASSIASPRTMSVSPTRR